MQSDIDIEHDPVELASFQFAVPSVLVIFPTENGRVHLALVLFESTWRRDGQSVLIMCINLLPKPTVCSVMVLADRPIGNEVWVLRGSSREQRGCRLSIDPDCICKVFNDPCKFLLFREFHRAPRVRMTCGLREEDEVFTAGQCTAFRIGYHPFTFYPDVEGVFMFWSFHSYTLHFLGVLLYRMSQREMTLHHIARAQYGHLRSEKLHQYSDRWLVVVSSVTHAVLTDQSHPSAEPSMQSRDAYTICIISTIIAYTATASKRLAASAHIPPALSNIPLPFTLHASASLASILTFLTCPTSFVNS